MYTIVSAGCCYKEGCCFISRLKRLNKSNKQFIVNLNGIILNTEHEIKTEFTYPHTLKHSTV